ncbi:MAG TPA: DUF5682 family protein [Saprospiraceae bacterium]|nr:DUF5682 family protein [Saprospiraceae bacterium]HMQ81568.1 DUF5682 family protein [Saprospiraceae bacterium]
MALFSIYGIRHHGPGSTRSLLKALEQQQPDCILVEMPADAEKAMSIFQYEDYELPLALLLYEDKNMDKAVYLPFAEFSAEWQTMRYAHSHQCPIWFMDLPIDIQLQFPESMDELTIGDDPFDLDPMGVMALLAGYEDSEQWWDATFEHTENDAAIFEYILQMIQAMRGDLNRPERPSNLLREAYMRITLRKALKEGFKNIAVVCGAWHGPAIQDVNRIKPASDQQLLKGWKKAKTSSSWIPWSYERLAYQSGYRAGVLSPAWYDLLFRHREEAIQRWMVQAAVLMREQGFETAAAQAIDAARLAHTLAAMRQKAIPEMVELKEAALAVYCQGQVEPLQLIEKALIIGRKVGQLPENAPVMPIQKDFDRQLKTFRLGKIFQSTAVENKILDLREPFHMAMSQFFHQLQLLDIHWGKTQEQEGRLGNFSESWQLKWQPEFSIKIIEAGTWGNAIKEAAENKALQKISQHQELNVLVGLFRASLLAGLETVFESLLRQLETAVALSKDTMQMMQAIPALADVIRYGDVRQSKPEAVAALLGQLLPRVSVGLPATCSQVDETVAKACYTLILEADRAVDLLESSEFTLIWNTTLQRMQAHPGIDRSIHGLCCRLLLDKGLLSSEQASLIMEFTLSYTREAAHAASWLEGFLQGSALILLHSKDLWSVLERWVKDVPEEHFTEMLPILRRTFARFSAPEREKILQLAKQVSLSMSETQTPSPIYHQQRAKQALPLLVQLLGLE